MKILILILTLLFSVSVLADCCNFEPAIEEISQSETHLEEACQDVTETHPHNDKGHCGCAHLSHLKMFHNLRSTVILPHALSLKKKPDPYQLKISTFNNRIFHPPKLLA